EPPAVAGEGPRGAPPAVGEKPSGQTAEEVALRDQAVLLRGGGVTLELGAWYARGERDFGVGQLQQSVAVGELAVRVGLVDDVQLSARVPWRYRHAVLVVPGDPAAPTSSDTHRGFGDLALGLFAVALHEGAGRPNLIFSLEGIAPTGPGDAGVGTGLSLTRSYDPVILFAGVSWMYGLRIDPHDPDRALAQHNVGFHAGYAFAVNESVALGGRLIGTFRNYGATPSGFRPSREQYRLQLGLTYLVIRQVFAEPTVTIGLGGASPDVVFGLSLPASF
ncbi:MAG TPA: transporter, partial [Anaeromyxobacteraceae bacterium]